jgi:hypothetical protein
LSKKKKEPVFSRTNVTGSPNLKLTEVQISEVQFLGYGKALRMAEIRKSLTSMSLAMAEICIRKRAMDFGSTTFACRNTAFCPGTALQTPGQMT